MSLISKTTHLVQARMCFVVGCHLCASQLGFDMVPKGKIFGHDPLEHPCHMFSLRLPPLYSQFGFGMAPKGKMLGHDLLEHACYHLVTTCNFSDLEF